ncbi:MAG: fatty acid desaturase [Leptospirales bacterium]|jgi:omega-6 fatty acid desaturase (delta-12 desaturase)
MNTSPPPKPVAPLDDALKLRQRVAQLREKYARPTPWKTAWQIINTVLPQFALTYVIYLNWSGPLWITIPLLILNSFFLIRVFVLFHDVMHGSSIRGRRAADVIGTLLGLIVFQPAHHWQYEHANHHAASNDLDRRGIGDMPLLTVREYAALSRPRRFMYRILRNPMFLFTVHAVYKQMIKPRWVAKREWPFRAHFSVYFTNAAIVAVAAGLWYAGLTEIFVAHAISFAIGTSSQLMLFYVNHHYESAAWQPGDRWNFLSTALDGTSIIAYPPILHWFAAGIGYHSPHHLLAKIPNYNLRACWKENPDVFANVYVVSYFDMPRTFRLRLWDEDEGRYVGREGYRSAERLSALQAA